MIQIQWAKTLPIIKENFIDLHIIDNLCSVWKWKCLHTGILKIFLRSIMSSSDKSCEFYVDIHFVTIINFSYFQCESACLISILFDVSAECILPFYSTTRHFNVYLTPSYTFLHTIHLPVLGFSLILSLILPYLILSSPHWIYTENTLE